MQPRANVAPGRAVAAVDLPGTRPSPAMLSRCWSASRLVTASGRTRPSSCASSGTCGSFGAAGNGGEPGKWQSLSGSSRSSRSSRSAPPLIWAGATAAYVSWCLPCFCSGPRSHRQSQSLPVGRAANVPLGGSTPQNAFAPCHGGRDAERPRCWSQGRNHCRVNGKLRAAPRGQSLAMTSMRRSSSRWSLKASNRRRQHANGKRSPVQTSRLGEPSRPLTCPELGRVRRCRLVVGRHRGW